MRILVYGDSNSWGLLDDGQGLRYDNRWPVIMTKALEAEFGTSVCLVEECLPGRTTAYPDPQEGPEYNGLPFLKPALLSHAPLDMVIIMLGTNDMKARFSASADAVTTNLINLAKIVRRAPVGNGKWREAPTPPVLLIAPAKLGERSKMTEWLRYDEWHEGYDKMAQIPAMLSAKVAALQDDNIHVFDANEGVTPSERDPIHWASACHHKMGELIAQKISSLL